MHEIIKCSCGAIISQCRCFQKDKPVREVANGCEKCKANQKQMKKDLLDITGGEDIVIKMHTHDEMAELPEDVKKRIRVIASHVWNINLHTNTLELDLVESEIAVKFERLLATELKTLEQKHAQELAEAIEAERARVVMLSRQRIMQLRRLIKGQCIKCANSSTLKNKKFCEFHRKKNLQYRKESGRSLKSLNSIQSLTTDTKEGVAPQKKEAPHWMDCNCECHGFNEDGEDENCPHCMPELYPDYVVAPQKGSDE